MSATSPVVMDSPEFLLLVRMRDRCTPYYDPTANAGAGAWISVVSGGAKVDVTEMTLKLEAAGLCAFHDHPPNRIDGGTRWTKTVSVTFAGRDAIGNAIGDAVNARRKKASI